MGLKSGDQEHQAIHCFISGRVQGVWFRAATEEQANLQGISGWVRNVADGRVEVFACGDAMALDQFKHWLQQGPPMARVLKVDCEVVEPQDLRGFSVWR